VENYDAEEAAEKQSKGSKVASGALRESRREGKASADFQKKQQMMKK